MTTVNQITPITISDLPNATALSGNEYVPITQLNSTVKVAISALPTGFGGATGSFVSQDGKSITVVNGIITVITP